MKFKFCSMLTIMQSEIDNLRSNTIIRNRLMHHIEPITSIVSLVVPNNLSSLVHFSSLDLKQGD